MNTHAQFLNAGTKSEGPLAGQLRPVDVSAEMPVVPADQPVPRLEWVEIADLRIDETYQRPLGPSSWRAIRDIAEDFRWDHFTPVICAPLPDGKLAIIDGQHRSHAAAICGFTRVPAMIVPISGACQAAAFAGINGKVTQITLFHVYKAALAAREGWAERSRDAVDSAGCYLMTSNRSTSAKKCGEVYAISLVRKLVTSGHSATITAVLKALRAIDGGQRAALYSDYVLRPLFDAVSSDPDYLRLDLAAFLRAHDPFRVMDRVKRENDTLRSRDARAAFIRLLKAWEVENGKRGDRG